MSYSKEIPNYLTKSQNISDRIEAKENKRTGWKRAKDIPKENNTPEFKRYPYGKNEPCNKPAKHKAYIISLSKVAKNSNDSVSGPPPPCNCTGPCSNCERKCCNLEKQSCLKYPNESCYPYGGFSNPPYNKFNEPIKVVPPTGKTCNSCIKTPKTKFGTCAKKPIQPLKNKPKTCKNAGTAGTTNSRNWIDPVVRKASCGCHIKGYSFAGKPFAGNNFHEKLKPPNHIVAKPGCNCPPPFGNQQYKDVDVDENKKTPPKKSSPFARVADSGQNYENNGVTRTGILAKARAKEAYERENSRRDEPYDDRFNHRPHIGKNKMLTESQSRNKIGSESSKSNYGKSSSSNYLAKSKTGSNYKVEKDSSKESHEFNVNDYEDDVDKKGEDSIEEGDGSESGKKFSKNAKGEKSEIVDENVEDKVETSSKISNKSKGSTTSKGSNKSTSSKGSKGSGSNKNKKNDESTEKYEDNDEEINDPY